MDEYACVFRYFGRLRNTCTLALLSLVFFKKLDQEIKETNMLLEEKQTKLDRCTDTVADKKKFTFAFRCTDFARHFRSVS